MTMFSDGLIFPAALLALLGWLVPRGLFLVFPEGIKPLLWLTFTATILMLFLGMGFFLLLYLWQGAPIDTLFEPGFLIGLAHFGRLGLISALLWAPIMILSVAGLPKLWTKETW
jgi:hypothetical protein